MITLFYFPNPNLYSPSMPKYTARCTSISNPINQLLRCPLVSYETEPPNMPSTPPEILISPGLMLSCVYFIPAGASMQRRQLGGVLVPKITLS